MVMNYRQIRDFGLILTRNHLRDDENEENKSVFDFDQQHDKKFIEKISYLFLFLKDILCNI